MPSSSTAALLALLSITLGSLVATVRNTADFRLLLAVLAVGQLLGHALLGVGGHSHPSAEGVPSLLMFAAHLAAVVVGAALIAAGGRLAAAVSRVLVATARPDRHPVAVTSSTLFVSADQPLQSLRFLSASLSHRGPPVGFAR